MKKTLTTLLSLALSVTTTAQTADYADYTAHEWGTFTSVSSSDGYLLDGLYLEEEKLPRFVHEFGGVRPINMKMSSNGPQPMVHVEGVNIKMETPVIYFYSDVEREVTVDVDFNGGIISQWYPQVRKPNRMPELCRQGDSWANLSFLHTESLDFRHHYQDKITWDLKVLSPDTFKSYTSPQDQETATWINPRFVDANLLDVKGQRERYLFYRGLARFNTPLTITAQSEQQITLSSPDDISFALVYEYSGAGKGKVWWTGAVKGGDNVVVKKKSHDVDQAINGDFLKGLVDAGLYEKEAKSMLETWRHSYFEKPGLRVFWVVPRKFTDEILPIKFKPSPKNLERVLVGRTEVMTPKAEEDFLYNFILNEKSYVSWYSGGMPDRFFQAWKSRVLQLLKETKSKELLVFEALKKLRPQGLPYGEYYIQRDKKKNLVTIKHLKTHDIIIQYKGDEHNGQATWYYHSPATKTARLMSGVRINPDRKILFTVRQGQVDGEVETRENITDKFIKTQNYAMGKYIKN